ncbi:hypothetical protein EI74_0802 [Mycoplasma testudineum]|uniref:Uncharacterized protein n=1 Tax=Mycoplasma testudineum TaxID=244584 RepID=A0A4R6IB22_9MOLU|nr:hypothetical protein [Mycoplasma testudineum]OYD26496.1 hypothetical protein CG473_03580 [Mycoplasma testudineum]TDO18984.1 hypothetical protein EI74_0802 [Mycoplasma testudineum]
MNNFTSKKLITKRQTVSSQSQIRTNALSQLLVSQNFKNIKIELTRDHVMDKYVERFLKYQKPYISFFWNSPFKLEFDNSIYAELDNYSIQFEDVMYASSFLNSRYGSPFSIAFGFFKIKPVYHKINADFFCCLYLTLFPENKKVSHFSKSNINLSTNNKEKFNSIFTDEKMDVLNEIFNDNIKNQISIIVENGEINILIQYSLHQRDLTLSNLAKMPWIYDFPMTKEYFHNWLTLVSRITNSLKILVKLFEA